MEVSGAVEVPDVPTTMWPTVVNRYGKQTRPGERERGPVLPSVRAAITEQRSPSSDHLSSHWFISRSTLTTTAFVTWQQHLDGISELLFGHVALLDNLNALTARFGVTVSHNPRLSGWHFNTV